MGASAAFLPMPVVYVLLSLAVLTLILHVALASGQKKKSRQNQAQAANILQAYGAEKAEDILRFAAAYTAETEQYERVCALCREQTQTAEQTQAELAEEETTILTAVRGFADNIYTLEDARSAIGQAEELHKQAADAALLAEHAKKNLAAIRQIVGDTADAVPEEDFSDRYSLPQIQRQLENAKQELSGVETTLAQHAGLVQSLGDPAALDAEKQQLENHITALKTREAALTAAMTALEEANRLQCSRFAPQISKVAGELLCRMTGGRYNSLRMEQDLTLHAKAASEAVTRELLTLSGGTGDQLYLALRLAICRMALEDGTPLVLDDALVYFDDTRLAQTMEVLKDEAFNRQILLFTCQSREGEYLKHSTL